MANAAQQKVFTEDRLALEWREMEQWRERLYVEISKYVREHGSRSHKRPGMQSARGAEFELLLTDWMQRKIRDPKALNKFLRTVPKRIALRAFHRRVVFTPSPDAEKFLMQHASAKALLLYRAAVRVKKGKARLQVRELKPGKTPAPAKKAA